MAVVFSHEPAAVIHRGCFGGSRKEPVGYRSVWSNLHVNILPSFDARLVSVGRWCRHKALTAILHQTSLKHCQTFLRDVLHSIHYVVYNNYKRFTAPWTLFGTTRVSWYQKGKSSLDLLEQEIVSGSGISWAICKSASHPRQPCQHSTTQFFTGRMPFLPPNQQRKSTVLYTNLDSKCDKQATVVSLCWKHCDDGWMYRGKFFSKSTRCS